MHAVYYGLIVPNMVGDAEKEKIWRDKMLAEVKDMQLRTQRVIDKMRETRKKLNEN